MTKSRRFTTPVPEGYTTVTLLSSYYGSHDERDGDEVFIVALPVGCVLPEGFELTHGSFGNGDGWEVLKKLSPDILIRRRESGSHWEPMESFRR